ncbi:MAG: LysR family transcriptional regulator [Clostridiales bacterium]|nr:LysR family transcriptional regulator [Clostridiales bacterium]
MDIKNIKTFVRVAELKNFTKAAQELNYVQSTVTMQIQLLEKELGFPLFDRVGKKISLTDLGREFLSYAYEIIHIFEKAETINKNDTEIKGSLRIGISESLLFSVLNDLLPDFKNKYKNVNISIKTGHTFELLEQIKQNQLDIIYVSKSKNSDPDINCYYLKKERLVFVAPLDHPLSKAKKVPLEEVFKHEFVVTEKEGICYSRLKEMAAQNGCSLLDVVEIDSVAVLIDLVKNGMGLAFLPEYAVKKQVNKKEIVLLDVEYPAQYYYSQILCHKSRWLSPWAKGFVSLIEQARVQTKKHP